MNDTFQRKNHKNIKIVLIIVIVVSFLISVLFGYLYYLSLKARPLIEYPQYTLSTTDWTSGNVIITVDTKNGKATSFSFDGGNNFQQENTYETLVNGEFNLVVKDINGRVSKITPLVIRNIDKDAPILSFENTTVPLGSNFSLRSGVVATDGEGSGLNSNFVTVPDKIDTSIPGKYTVTYTVFDNVGNYTEKTRTIIVSNTQGKTYYRYRTATFESYQCEPYLCNCVVTESAKLDGTCPTGYTFSEPSECCQTCYKTCRKTNWSEWSEWSTDKIAATSTREVETKVE